MIIAIVITVIILLIFASKSESFQEKRMVTSSIDGRDYSISAGSWWGSSSLDGSNAKFVKSANMLAYMNKFIVCVLRFIRARYLRSGDTPSWYPFTSTGEFRAFLNRLIDRYDPNVLRENVPTSTKNHYKNGFRAELKSSKT